MAQDFISWDDDDINLDLLLGDYTDYEDEKKSGSQVQNSPVYVCPACMKELKSISGFRGHVSQKHGLDKVKDLIDKVAELCGPRACANSCTCCNRMNDIKLLLPRLQLHMMDITFKLERMGSQEKRLNSSVTDLDAQVRQLEAECLKKHADKEEERAARKQAQADLLTAQADLWKERAARRQAQATEQAAREWAGKRVRAETTARRQEKQASQAAHQALQADLEAAQADLETAQANHLAANQANQAALQANQAALQQLRAGAEEITHLSYAQVGQGRQKALHAVLKASMEQSVYYNRMMNRMTPANKAPFRQVMAGLRGGRLRGGEEAIYGKVLSVVGDWAALNHDGEWGACIGTLIEDFGRGILQFKRDAAPNNPGERFEFRHRR